jgi:hypothetical protein
MKNKKEKKWIKIDLFICIFFVFCFLDLFFLFLCCFAFCLEKKQNKIKVKKIEKNKINTKKIIQMDIYFFLLFLSFFPIYCISICFSNFEVLLFDFLCIFVFLYLFFSY